MKVVLAVLGGEDQHHMAAVGHLGPDILPFQGLCQGIPIRRGQSQPGGIQVQLSLLQAGEGGAEGGSAPGHPAVFFGPISLQIVPGAVQGDHHGVGWAGAAEHRGHLPHPPGVHAVGKQQGGLAQGGQGLVGGADEGVAAGKGVHAQKGQVGSMGAVHDQVSTSGMNDVGKFLDIRQHSGISRRCNTDSFDIWVEIQKVFHIRGGNWAGDPLPCPPGPGQIDGL